MLASDKPNGPVTVCGADGYTSRYGGIYTLYTDSFSGRGRIDQWDCDKRLGSLLPASEDIEQATVMPSLDRIATCSRDFASDWADSPVVKLWDTKGKLLCRAPQDAWGDMAMDPRGKIVVIYGESGLWILSAKDLSILYRTKEKYRGGPVFPGAYGPRRYGSDFGQTDCPLMLMVDEGGEIRLFGDYREPRRLNPMMGCSCIAVSQEQEPRESGQPVRSKLAGLGYQGNKAYLYLWQVTDFDLKMIKRFEVPYSYYSRMTWVGQSVVAIAEERSILLVHVDPGKVVGRLAGHTDKIVSLLCDGRGFYSSSEDGVVIGWDMQAILNWCDRAK